MPVKPPRPKGPHLNAMRAFEAAARLGGFAAAADELSVTPGAISQQVKALEDWVGAPLFERRSQGVMLTPIGKSVVGDFEAAFDALGGALHQLRAHATQSTINIAALPSVAQLWLSPRLPAIRRALPGQAISITALESPPNMQRELFDLGLFFGTPSEDRTERVLARDVMYPVCTPQIAQSLDTPADLVRETLIHDAIWKDDWATWMRNAGQSTARCEAGPVFSLYSIALEEACNGAGVLIGHDILIEKHLRAGTLVAPFDEICLSGRSLILRTAGFSDTAKSVRQVAELLVASV
jgi:LysR family glycine cleavage system transcriptional activator